MKYRIFWRLHATFRQFSTEATSSSSLKDFILAEAERRAWRAEGGEGDTFQRFPWLNDAKWLCKTKFVG